MLYQRIVLLQPEEVLQARIESIPDFAKYIEQAQSIVEQYLTHLSQGCVVIAVRADGEQRFWFDFEHPIARDVQLLLRRSLQNLFSFDVYDSVVLVVIQYYSGEPSLFMPNPVEWQNAPKFDGMSLEELVLSVW